MPKPLGMSPLEASPAREFRIGCIKLPVAPGVPKRTPILREPYYQLLPDEIKLFLPVQIAKVSISRSNIGVRGQTWRPGRRDWQVDIGPTKDNRTLCSG